MRLVLDTNVVVSALLKPASVPGRAHAIVTGNIRDYPGGLGFDVHPPATLLAMLG